jgi:TnpA family transposase
MKDGSDYYKAFYESWVDFNRSMMEKSISAIKDSWDPATYEKFYSAWSQNMSEMMEKVMRAPGFAETSWNAFKGTTGFQKFFQLMTDTYLKNMNIPTREEYEEVSKRLDYLDDRLENIEKMLDQKPARKPCARPGKSSPKKTAATGGKGATK